jgi:hypothetical protein
MEKRLTLAFGYEGRPGEHVRDVVVGRRVTGGDLIRIGDEADGQGQTQFQLAVLQAAITKFGDLKLPVPMNVLLSLKRPDRRQIGRAYDEFCKEQGETGKAEKLAAGRYRLAHGFTVGEVVYDVVEFGNHLTGYDEIDADEMSGYRQACFLMGREITRLSQSSGPASMAGPLEVEAFESLYAEDVFALQRFENDWYDSFRPQEGEPVQAGAGDRSDVSDDVSQAAGGGDSQLVS